MSQGRIPLMSQGQIPLARRWPRASLSAAKGTYWLRVQQSYKPKGIQTGQYWPDKPNKPVPSQAKPNKPVPSQAERVQERCLVTALGNTYRHKGCIVTLRIKERYESSVHNVYRTDHFDPARHPSLSIHPSDWTTFEACFWAGDGSQSTITILTRAKRIV